MNHLHTSLVSNILSPYYRTFLYLDPKYLYVQYSTPSTRLLLSLRARPRWDYHVRVHSWFGVPLSPFWGKAMIGVPGASLAPWMSRTTGHAKTWLMIRPPAPRIHFWLR